MSRQRRQRRSKNNAAGSNTLLHLSFSNDSIQDHSRFTKKVCNGDDVRPLAKSYVVTISGQQYSIAEPNGAQPQNLGNITLYKGLTYEFDQSDSSMVNHRFRLSSEFDGTHEGADQYTVGWTEEGTPGTSGAKAVFTVDNSVPSELYYYDANFDGRGSENATVFFETLSDITYAQVYRRGGHSFEDNEGSSAYFNGDAGLFISGYGYDHASDLNVDKDFTISFWAKSNATGYSTDQCLFDFGGLTGFVRSGVSSYIPMDTGWSGENLNIVSVSEANYSGWNHFCLMRQSGSLRYYINGTGQGEAKEYTGALHAYSNSSTGVYHTVGCTRNYNNFYSGYINDFLFHNTAVYGFDGFTPIEEDVSGKFSSIAKDGLTAKHTSSRIYLISDGGYRDFEMYNSDSLNVKLPSTGNIIQKDNKDYANQYVYPLQGQDLIVSFYKDPNLIDARESKTKFYFDSGDGRKEIDYSSQLENNIHITSNLKPRYLKYYSTGDLDQNATHLIVKSIQSGFTGTFSAEHWEGDRVYSTPRKVIVKDVILETGCVRPEITGLEARGQIMSLATPSIYGSTAPVWTGNCRDSNYLKSSYRFPNNDSTGIKSHYRIFSGWLEGDSLPSFNVVSGTRYDGSTDNSNIKFIISEECKGPHKGSFPTTRGVSGDWTIGVKNHSTGQYDYPANLIYKEFTFNEVSGMPVQTFKYYDKFSQKLIETSGRLLISGDGTSEDDNAVCGSTCMTLTIVDDIAKSQCFISNEIKNTNCLHECFKEGRCPSAISCVHTDPCEAFSPAEVCCSGACGSYKKSSDVQAGGYKDVFGWQERGYTSQAACESGCINCGSLLPSIASSLTHRGTWSVNEGEIRDIVATAYRGNVVWYECTKSEAENINGRLLNVESNCTKVQGEGIYTQYGTISRVRKQFCKSDDGNVYVPIASYNPRLDPSTIPLSNCEGSKVMGESLTVNVGDAVDINIVWPKNDTTFKIKRGRKQTLDVHAEGAHPIEYTWYTKENDKLSGTHGSKITVSPETSTCYYAVAASPSVNCDNSTAKRQKRSPRICIEVLDQTEEEQCCLDTKTRTFEIPDGDSCRITSIKGYEIWTGLMGSYSSDYKHGRVITPTVTSKSNNSWTTKWHDLDNGICYNSGVDPNKSQNNQWCSSKATNDCFVPCFTTSGCPDKIIYEVITQSGEFKRSFTFTDNPLGQTGNLYVQYANTKSYTGSSACGCPDREIHWTFPTYNNGSGTSNYTCDGQTCDFNARLVSDGTSDNAGFTPNIGHVYRILPFTNCFEWQDNSYGYINFVWSGYTVTGLGSYYRINGGNDSNSPAGQWSRGAPESFKENKNLWNVDIKQNLTSGVTHSGTYNYSGLWASGDKTLHSFTRTLKDRYFNIRNTPNRQIINLISLVPVNSRSTETKYRTTTLYTAQNQATVFSISDVEKTDSYGTENPGGDFANGYNRENDSSVGVWCHQSGTTAPWAIYNGWESICDSSITGFTSGECQSGHGDAYYGYDCYCQQREVTSTRYDEASILHNYPSPEYLNLMYVLQSGDIFKSEIFEYSGWNSFLHGDLLIVNEPTGNWENFTGSAEIPLYKTFIDGKEV